MLQTGRLNTGGGAARFHAYLCTLGSGRDGPLTRPPLSDRIQPCDPVGDTLLLWGGPWCWGRGQASSQGWPYLKTRARGLRGGPGLRSAAVEPLASCQALCPSVPHECWGLRLELIGQMAPPGLGSLPHTRKGQHRPPGKLGAWASLWEPQRDGPGHAGLESPRNASCELKL